MEKSVGIFSHPVEGTNVIPNCNIRDKYYSSPRITDVLWAILLMSSRMGGARATPTHQLLAALYRNNCSSPAARTWDCTCPGWRIQGNHHGTDRYFQGQLLKVDTIGNATTKCCNRQWSAATLWATALTAVSPGVEPMSLISDIIGLQSYYTKVAAVGSVAFCRVNCRVTQTPPFS